MQSTLQNKVALVTGAGRGIGRACALALAARGCRVALVSRTQRELDEVAKTIRQMHPYVLAHAADIADEASVNTLFREIRTLWGTVDILVNNAAIFSKAAVVDHHVRDWDAVMAVNVRGIFLTSRHVFRDCVATKKGASIVNISSLAGVRGTEKFPGLASYSTSKFAVVGLSESLAVEGRPLGIRVNCIAPGAVDTDMLRKAAPHLKTQTTPDEIAKTVIYLCDDAQSSHLNGSLIEVFSNA